MRSLFLTVALLPQLLGAVSLWDPTGPYHVGYTQHVFNHSTPVDPTPNPGIILLSIYYPTLQTPNSTVPYADATTARAFEQAFGLSNGSLSKVTTKLQFQAPTLLGTDPCFGNGSSPYPTIIFTPGAGSVVAGHTAYMSELASHGFAVVGIDHPGESPYTALPYGAPGVPGPPTLINATADVFRQIYNYRVADIQAVMSSPFLPSLIAAYGAPFNTTHYAVFGHSIGGAGAAGAIIASPGLFRAGGNLDGTFQHLAKPSADGAANVPDPDAPNPDLRTPFLELAAEARFHGREDAGGGSEDDTTWQHFNSNQSAWLRDVQVNGTAHLDYTDFPLLADALDERGGPVAATQLGTIAGTRVTEVVAGLLVRFFGEMVGGGEGLGVGAGSVDGFIGGTEEAFVLAERG